MRRSPVIRRTATALASLLVSVGMVLGGGLVAAPAAHAVAYCAPYRHYGPCTYSENYMLSLQYWSQRLNQEMNARSVILRAQSDAARAITRNP